MNPLGLIVDAVPALIAYVDRDRRSVFANLAYEAWFGRPRSEIPGRALRDLLGEERYAQVQPYVERALAGESVAFESTATHRDGTLRFVRAVYVPDVGPDGTVRGYVSLVSDITDLSMTETALRDQAVALERARAEAEDANRSKDEFLATLSHELRTPLNAGLGMPPEVSSRIFEPFFTTKGPKGSGLGLSVSWGIINSSGGTITVDSTPGVGTRLTVRLPIPDALPDEPAGPAAPAERACW